MFYREIIENLNNWAEWKNRKPLILRGARQVGKTTAVEMFSKQFDQYISLNLESGEEQSLELLQKDEVPAFLHSHLMRLFKQYITIGGMPQVVEEYVQNKDITAFVMNKLHFWVREKKQSSAEIDYIFQHNGKLIPIEVKSGAIGKLRSLHQFIDQAPHNIAVRVYQGEYLVQKAKTIAGKEFTLLNLPFYLVHRIERELDKVMI